MKIPKSFYGQVEKHRQFQMPGMLSVLNVGHGDLTLSFDASNQAERNRAKRIVEDMLKRGYAILVKVGEQDGEPIFKRAKAFDPNTCEYIVSGDAPLDAKSAEPRKRPAKRSRQVKRYPATSTPAVSVARSAGGYDPILIDRLQRGLP